MIVIAILIGLLVGQLLNLFLERFYSDRSLAGPMLICRFCDAPAGALDFLPIVGYLSRAGRCPSCRRLLSIRTLLLPAGCAALFALGYLAQDRQFGAGLLAGGFCSIFLALVFTDLDRHIIPDRLTYPAMIAAALLAWGWTDRSLASIYIGGGSALLIAVGLFVLGRGGFFLGDVKMLILMGLTSGFPYFLSGLLITAILGGVVAILLLVTRIKGMKEFMPYGPFIAAGAIVTTLWGPALWN